MNRRILDKIIGQIEERNISKEIKKGLPLNKKDNNVVFSNLSEIKSAKKKKQDIFKILVIVGISIPVIMLIKNKV